MRTKQSFKGGGADRTPARGQLFQPALINLGNHCLFCLQHQEVDTLLEVAGRNPQLSKNPRPIIHYLTGTDPSYDRSEEELEEMGIPASAKTTFPLMMCPSCYDILVELHRLHRQLLEVQRMIQKQTESAREMIINSQNATSSTVSSRQQFYSKIQSSGMSLDEVTTAAKFVDNFCTKLVFEAVGKNKVKFPVSLPVDSPPVILQSHQDIGGFNSAKSQNSNSEFVVIQLPLEPEPEQPDVFKHEAEDIAKHEEDLFEELEDPLESDVKNEDEGELDGGNFSPSSSGQSSRSLAPSSPEPTTSKRTRKRQFNETVKPSTSHPKVRKLEFSSRGKSTPNVGRKRTCDVCVEKIPLTKMRDHLEGHNLKDYIINCPNPNCIFVFSCRGQMERHLRNKEFQDCQKLFKHIQSLPTRKCETCSLEVTKTWFQRHLDSHEIELKDAKMPCPIPSCPDRYALRQSIEEHLMTHDRRVAKRSEEQECSVCNQRIKVEDVEEHLKEVHEVGQLIRCRRCPFLFHDWKTLLDHLEKHRFKRNSKFTYGGFFCDICNDDSGVKYKSYDSLRMHFFNVHKIGKEYFCEVCDRKFFFEPTLSLHHKKMHSIRTQLNQNPVKIMTTKKKYYHKCEECPDTRFSTKTALQTHQIKEHGALPLTCKFCSEKFVSAHALEKHEQDHRGLRRTYKCRVADCGRVFTELSLWQDHERGAHNNDPNFKQFVCDTCGKGYNSRHCLYSHKRKVHMGKKKPRPICEICGESFSTSTSLKMHNLIHTGERPYQCTICGQAFRHKEVLKTHLKSHETKGDNFKPNGPMKNVRKRVAVAPATATEDN